LISIEEFSELLDEIAEELPVEFFKELNGGIILKKKAKLHPKSEGDDLYVMGEYSVSRQMGKQIFIYYGSFEKIYCDAGKGRIKNKLRKTVLHEFQHHLEKMAGEKQLEIEDQQQLIKYQKKKNERE